MTLTLAAAWVGSVALSALLGLGLGLRVGRMRALSPAASVLGALPPPDDERWTPAAKLEPCTVIKCKWKNHSAWVLGDVKVHDDCQTFVQGCNIADAAAGRRYARAVQEAQQRRRALESWT